MHFVCLPTYIFKSITVIIFEKSISFRLPSCLILVNENKALKIKHRDSSKLEKKFGNLKRKFGIPKVSNLMRGIACLTEAEKTVLTCGFSLTPKEVDRF